MNPGDKYWRVLIDVAKALTTARNIPALLYFLVVSIANAIEAKAVSIRLLDEQGKRLEPAAAYGLTDDYFSGEPMDVSESPVDQEVLSGKVVYVADVTSDPRWRRPDEARREGIASVLSTRLAVRGSQNIGTVKVYTGEPREFTAEDIEFVEALASMGATAVESARIYQASETRCANLSVLNDVAERINESLRPTEVVRLITEEVAKAMNVKASSLRLLDESGGYLNLAAAYGLSDEYLAKGPVRLENSPIDYEALQGHPVAIEDVTTDPRWQYPEEARREGIVSVLAAPLITKGRGVGVIRVYTGEPRLFSPEEKELLEAIGRHAAIAVENARLYEIALSNYDQLTQEVWQGLPDVWGTVVG